MEDKVFIGTCGFSYPEWKENFYPKDLPQSGFLRFYSLVFPFVEIDYSWYAMPSPSSIAQMASQTHPEFLFALKAYKGLTHDIGEDWPKDAERFSHAAEVLSSRGKLAAILIQLPFRFSYTVENRSYLGDLCSALSGFPLVVEFRNDSWYKQRVFDELAKRKISLAMLDRPELRGLPPEIDLITSPIAYYRLHGRNADTWWNGTVTTRYDYDYSMQEIKEKARTISALTKRAERVFAAFNNHASGNAAKNARSLAVAIKELSFE